MVLHLMKELNSFQIITIAMIIWKKDGIVKKTS